MATCALQVVTIVTVCSNSSSLTSELNTAIDTQQRQQASCSSASAQQRLLDRHRPTAGLVQVNTAAISRLLHCLSHHTISRRRRIKQFHYVHWFSISENRTQLYNLQPIAFVIIHGDLRWNYQLRYSSHGSANESVVLTADKVGYNAR